MKALDQKDLRILEALERMGGNASAPEIAEALTPTIPARTIRYRLSKLMERGILLPTFIQTCERKIGLGQQILVVQENQKKSEELEHLIRDLPLFYWYVPTHGRFDGHLIHSVYDLNNNATVAEIAESMKDKGFIHDYYTFDILDYRTKKVDFSKYDPGGDWSWDWKNWIITLQDEPHEPSISAQAWCEGKNPISYDATDIKLVRALKRDADMTISDLVTLTDCSIAEVRNRIQRLRDKGVIKGYRRAYGFAGDLLWISCFLDIREHVDSILEKLLELPFPGVLLLNSPSKFCLRLGMTTPHLKRFFQGFRQIRSNMNSYFFQFHLPDLIDSDFQDVFDFYDEEEGHWEIPTSEYVDMVRKHQG